MLTCMPASSAELVMGLAELWLCCAQVLEEVAEWVKARYLSFARCGRRLCTKLWQLWR